MVNQDPRTLDRVFGALADPTRRSMLEALKSGDRTLGQLAEPFEMSLPAVSKHLRVLEQAGLVETTKEGRARICHFTPDPLRDARDWLESQASFWNQKLDALERVLSEDQNG